MPGDRFRIILELHNDLPAFADCIHSIGIVLRRLMGTVACAVIPLAALAIGTHEGEEKFPMRWDLYLSELGHTPDTCTDHAS